MIVALNRPQGLRLKLRASTAHVVVIGVSQVIGAQPDRPRQSRSPCATQENTLSSFRARGKTRLLRPQPEKTAATEDHAQNVAIGLVCARDAVALGRTVAYAFSRRFRRGGKGWTGLGYSCRVHSLWGDAAASASISPIKTLKTHCHRGGICSAGTRPTY